MIGNREVIEDKELRFNTVIDFWQLISDEEMVNSYKAAGAELGKNDFRTKWVMNRADCYFYNNGGHASREECLAQAMIAYDREVGFEHDTRNYNPDNT